MAKATRYLEVKPLKEGLFLVTDPLGIADDFIVNPLVLQIMLLFDGKRDDEEVRKEIIRQTGIFIPEEKFKEIVFFFENNSLFLEIHKGDIRDLILKRSQDLINKGYINSYFEVDSVEFKSFLKLDEINKNGKYKAALVPHLDLRISVEAYYKAYNELKKDGYPRVFIFGVSHYFHGGLFSVCPLDFKTPLGTLKTDKEVVINFQSHFDINPFEYVLSYRKEHSIHFQLPYIKYIFDNSKVVAVLVSYDNDFESVRKELDRFADFISSFYPDSLFISSIDLSHVGEKFGDSSLIDPEKIDQQYIDLLLLLNYEESLNFLIKNENITRIDGMLTNYLFLKVLSNLGFTKGNLILYDKYFEKTTNSIVSYCSIVYK
ncbi:MAG: AmmeMemoRadiSam system protein B [bacterium]